MFEADSASVASRSLSLHRRAGAGGTLGPYLAVRRTVRTAAAAAGAGRGAVRTVPAAPAAGERRQAAVRTVPEAPAPGEGRPVTARKETDDLRGARRGHPEPYLTQVAGISPDLKSKGNAIIDLNTVQFSAFSLNQSNTTP